MPTTRKRQIPRLKSVPDLAGEIRSYLSNRSMRERSEHEEGRLKRLLMSVLEETGDQVGNKQVILLDESLPYRQYRNGKPVDKLVAGIERRESTTRLDEDKALEFLNQPKNKELLSECTTTIVVVDEDALLAANFDGKITDRQLAALYTDTTRHAFWLAEEPS